MKKGSKMSIESRQKMSIAMKGNSNGSHNKGKNHTEVTKEKISISMRGKKSGAKCNFWKGGISTENNRLRASADFKKWRMAVFTRDNFTCQHCGLVFIKGKTGDVKLNAHHIKSFSKYPQFRFDVSNGITLCEPCHFKTDNYRKSM